MWGLGWGFDARKAFLKVVKCHICSSSGYDITAWQTQLVTQILTRVKGIFVQIAYQKNIEIRKNKQCSFELASVFKDLPTRLLGAAL